MKGIYDQENKGNINRHAAEDGAGRAATPGSPEARNLTTKQLCTYNLDMSRRYVVPEEGLNAAVDAQELRCDPVITKIGLEAFIRWQSENPRVPTLEQLWSCGKDAGGQTNAFDGTIAMIAAWLRRMYLAPKPEVPEEKAARYGR